MVLKDFFEVNKEVAIAFSGGVDSAFLLYSAVKHTDRITAYYVKSAFQPQFELDDAIRFADEIGADLKIIEVDVLSDKTVTSNPADRCYYCKKHIFEAICNLAKEDGYSVILDGTNASDDTSDRPGMKALRELEVKSPLRECGLTKQMIRSLSRQANLFVWDKPAYACLATRIPTGEKITLKKLQDTEKAEDFLFSLGFTDFRVRHPQNDAKLQFKADEISSAKEKLETIKAELGKYYDNVYIDEEVKR